MFSSNGEGSITEASKKSGREHTFTSRTRDPKMITISCYEIQYLLLRETYSRIFLIFGTVFCSGVISAVVSNVEVNTLLIVVSVIIFVVGIIFDLWYTHINFEYLKEVD